MLPVCWSTTDGRTTASNPPCTTRAGLAFERLIRLPVPSQIHRYEPMRLRQIRAHLASPREPALRNSVHEQNRSAVSVASIDNMKLDPATPSDVCVSEPSAGCAVSA